MAMLPSDVTETFVNETEDFDVLDQLLQRFGISEDGLNSIDDYKAAIKTYIHTAKCGSRKEELFGAIAGAGEKDSEKRERLRTLLKEIIDIFPETSSIQQQLLQDLLHKDGVLMDHDIRAECSSRIGNLSDNKCAILIAGETSAGKSSLLNLLLGEEILPSNTLPCTSSITVIRYSDMRSAKVIFTSGAQKVIPNLDASGLAELKKIAFIDENNAMDGLSAYQRRRDGHNIAEIQVALPLPFLKSGLVLVDTPGVGENEFLENYLMEYIRSHQILGFMYIIMSDQAGGIAEDRIVSLLSMIVKEQNASTHILRFNPKAALFVCNRWDLVEEEYKNKVRQNALKKLAKCWPDFQESQVLTFSTALAKKEKNIHKDYIGEESTKLLTAIVDLLETAVDRRSSTAFKWLGNLLQRSYHYMKSVVWRLELSERERTTTSKQALKKLETLETKTDGVIHRLRKDIDLAVNDICKKARDHLKQDLVKEQITQNWGSKDLPDLQKGSGSWPWIKNYIDASFNTRLVDCLEEWDNVQKNIPHHADKIAREAKLRLSALEKELSEIEKEAEHAEDDMSIASFTSLSSSFRCQSLQDLQVEDADISIPSRILARFVLKRITKKINESKMRKFCNEPAKMAEERSKKVLKKILHPGNQDVLQDIVQQMMQRPISYINRLENKIPKLIHANELLLAELERLCATQDLHRATYEGMIAGIECVRRRLASFGEDFVYANDFRGDDIRLIKEKSESGTTFLKSSISDLVRFGSSTESRPDIPCGLWNSVFRGISTSGHQEKHISVRVYAVNVGISNCSSEVAKLRCLLHTDVCMAEFLGIYELADHALPAFVFSGHVISLRKYLRSQEGRTDYMSTSLKSLIDICTGLQYLHAKRLVHMEVTQDTITVTERGEVQLTGCCMPRKADIQNFEEKTSSGFVYLAPEVLLGETYTASSDVYAFVLVLLEVLLKCEVFAEQKSEKLVDFVRQLNPATTLGQLITSDMFPPYLKAVIRQSVSMDRRSRPDIAIVAAKVKECERSGFVQLGNGVSVGSLFRKSTTKNK